MHACKQRRIERFTVAILSKILSNSIANYLLAEKDTNISPLVFQTVTAFALLLDHVGPHCQFPQLHQGGPWNLLPLRLVK